MFKTMVLKTKSFPLTANSPYLILTIQIVSIFKIGGIYNIVVPFRQYLSLLGWLPLVLLMFSGCTGLGKRLEPPRITLANIKVQEVKVFESVFEIEIRLFNTNDVALEIKGLECDLELNDRRFATGVSAVQTTIPPYETALLPITVYSSVLDVVTGLQGLSKTEKLEYKITGNLRLGQGAIPAVIPFKTRGEMPLEQMLLHEGR